MVNLIAAVEARGVEGLVGGMVGDSSMACGWGEPSIEGRVDAEFGVRGYGGWS